MRNNPRPARFYRRHGRWPAWFGQPGGGFVPIWGAYGPYASYSVPGVSAYPYYEQMPGSVAYIPQNMQTPSSDEAMEAAAMKAEAAPAPAAPTFEPAKASDVAAAGGVEGVTASGGLLGVSWKHWAMGAGGLALLLLLGGKN